MKTIFPTTLQAAALTLLALCAASLVGCASSKQPGSYSHGAVTVKGRSDAEVRQVTKTVFAESKYSLASEGAEYMEFERPGSRFDSIKWGGWLSQGVIIRVKVKMTKLADNSCRLQLDMIAVQDADDGVFESGNRMIMLNKQPYHRLLKEVDKRLRAQ